MNAGGCDLALFVYLVGCVALYPCRCGMAFGNVISVPPLLFDPTRRARRPLSGKLRHNPDAQDYLYSCPCLGCFFRSNPARFTITYIDKLSNEKYCDTPLEQILMFHTPLFELVKQSPVYTTENRTRVSYVADGLVSPWTIMLRLGVTYEKGVTLGNVTMSHRTRERPAECLASLSHSTMIGLPRAQH
ncbi:hypothetical protein EVAR_19578_1 [Eumeta japonica]|uniref:Uncharacterized protein n=1 Tax=Eumeta variegata TaxID=151549 RepID=A0A4C1UFC5_EUMVA|nr:hypothetical protein EVAR_19578_1 [Eumeta japonica]